MCATCVGVEARLGTRVKWQELRQRRSVKAEDPRVPHEDGRADSDWFGHLATLEAEEERDSSWVNSLASCWNRAWQSGLDEVWGKVWALPNLEGLRDI